MRFFTPELYVAFNATDDAIADQANEAWDKAILEYQQHLDRHRAFMPPSVRALTETCFHDARLLGDEIPVEHWPVGSSWSAVAVLSLEQEAVVTVLFYQLWDYIRGSAPASDWPFHDTEPHWLYDEVAVEPGDLTRFRHRILLSHGAIIDVPFSNVLIHRAVREWPRGAPTQLAA